MRLCTTVPLCLAAAAVSFPVPAYAEAPVRTPAPTQAAAAHAPAFARAFAYAPASQQAPFLRAAPEQAAPAALTPACAAADGGGFPLTTRLRGGPSSYRAGGGFGTWYLDLTNTTGRTCAGIHPVVVLVDSARALTPDQPHLDFYADGRPRAVHFERTDEDELVGALADEAADAHDPFPGFTVGPGRTVTVKLRLALTSDTAPSAVTVNAAVVQRHGDDGDWVGQSNDYRFAVEKEPRPVPTPGTPGTPRPDGDPEASAPETSPSPGDSPSFAEEAEELAGTGLVSALGLLAVTACLLGVGAALVLVRRRR